MIIYFIGMIINESQRKCLIGQDDQLRESVLY